MKPKREDVQYEWRLLEWWLLVDGSVLDFFLVCFFYSKFFTKILHCVNQHFITINMDGKLFFPRSTM